MEIGTTYTEDVKRHLISDVCSLLRGRRGQQELLSSYGTRRGAYLSATLFFTAMLLVLERASFCSKSPTLKVASAILMQQPRDDMHIGTRRLEFF